MSSLDQRQNYYMLLNLDPEVTDEAAINAAIAAKKRQWSTEASQGNSAVRRKAALNLKGVADIQRVMADADARREESRDAKRRLEAQRQEQFAELDRLIPILRLEGGCTEEYVAHIYKEILKEKIDEKDIRARLTAAGLSIIREANQSVVKAGKERLDPARLSQMRPNLALIGVSSIYEFLELSPKSSSKMLWNRADEVNRELLRIGKTDPESAARKELCGACLAIFRSDAERAKYDNSLAYEVMEQLRPVIEVAGRDGFLSLEEQDEVIRQARTRGVEAGEARIYLEEFAKHRKWGIQRAQTLPSESLQQCGYCFTLEQVPNAERCAKCGESLTISCPRCTAKMPTTMAACTQCGCRVGDAPVVKALLADAKRQASARELAAAVALLDQCLAYWDKWKPAEDLLDAIRAQQRAKNEMLREIEGLMARHQICAARARLEHVQRTFGRADTSRQEDEITRILVRANKLVDEADAARRNGRVEEALDGYERAVALCGDLERARKAVLEFPPLAPTSLTVSSLAAGFRLGWTQGGRTERIIFRVVRSEQGQPQTAVDATVLGDVSVCSLDDTTPPVGVPIYYAVYAARNGVYSRTAAIVGPLLLAGEVSGLEGVGGDGRVRLRWTQPTGAIRVDAWRRTGGGSDSQGRLAAGLDGTEDIGLRNGTPYEYVVRAIYQDPLKKGGECASQGVTVRVTPAPPPPEVTDLRAERIGDTIRLVWTPPRSGDVQVRWSGQMPPFAPGTVVPASTVGRLGGAVDHVGAGCAEWRVQRQGLLVFTPVTINGGSARVGSATSITTIQDVRELGVHASGCELMLHWDWPDGADEVLICYRHDGYPEAATEVGCQQLSVTRTRYDKTKGVQLTARETKPYYFTVFVRAPGQDLYSAGIRAYESMGQSTIVRYRAASKRSGFLNRTIAAAWLELECSEPLSSLPPVIVLGKAQQQPLSPRDGILLAELDSVPFVNGRARIDIPKEKATAPMFVKMFFKDGSHAGEIRLLPASARELRLG